MVATPRRPPFSSGSVCAERLTSSKASGARASGPTRRSTGSSPPNGLPADPAGHTEHAKQSAEGTHSFLRLHRLRRAVHAADTLDSDPVRHRATVASQAEERSGLRPSTLMVAVLVVTALEYAVWCFVQGQGITLTGDEPHYLVIATSLTHLDPHVLWAYQRVSHTHYIDIGPQLTLAATNTFVGPHGPLSVHDIGLPMLIAPCFAVGGTGGALLGFDLLLAIGFVVLHQRASRLAGLGTAGRWVFAVAMAGPALWLASTQLYPDLISGLFLAVAFVE